VSVIPDFFSQRHRRLRAPKVCCAGQSPHVSTNNPLRRRIVEERSSTAARNQKTVTAAATAPSDDDCGATTSRWTTKYCLLSLSMPVFSFSRWAEMQRLTCNRRSAKRKAQKTGQIAPRKNQHSLLNFARDCCVRSADRLKIRTQLPHHTHTHTRIPR
jgi:hypothetical protein